MVFGMNVTAANRRNSPLISRQTYLSATPSVSALLLLCLGSGFLLPSNAAWSMLFYLTVLPLVLLRVARGWRPDWHNRTFDIMLLLTAWSGISVFWGDDISGHGNGDFYWLRDMLCTLSFICAFVMAVEEEKLTRERAILTLVFCGTLNAAISLFVCLLRGAAIHRLQGWGVTANPVLGAAIIGGCLILAIGQAVEDKSGRAAMLSCAFVMSVYLLLTFSRTPLLAIAVALGILGVGAGLRLWGGGLAVLACLCALVLIFGHAELRPMWQNFAARGSDCHLFIWQTAWDEFLRRPLLGFGPAARLPIQPVGFCPAYPSPHNLYLSLLFYSGIIGFALFFTVVFLLWRRLRQLPAGFGRRRWLALAVIPLIVGASDLSQIIKGPSPMWYIIWLPMLFALTVEA
jgi:O-antigen ligase